LGQHLPLLTGARSDAEILAILGSRTRDLDVIFETTLEQLTGLLEMVARYGDQAGDATAPLPESLARQVEHIRVIAQEMARSLSLLRPSHGPAVPGVVQDGMLTIPTYQSANCPSTPGSRLWPQVTRRWRMPSWTASFNMRTACH
jgi:hypothetical protein